MNVIDVFEWDFVLNKGEWKYGCNDISEGLQKGREIAKQFCEDEEPTQLKITDHTWAFKTNCDYGTVVKTREMKED